VKASIRMRTGVCVCVALCIATV